MAPLIIASLPSCSKRFHDLPAFSAIPIYDAFNHSVGRFKTSYLADQIHAYYRARTSGTIGIATFVNIDNLYGSSTFGRLISEQLMSELVMKGYNVIELRQADALQIMSGEGEFALSREAGSLKSWQELAGIVVGTYVESPQRVYVNARIIDPSNSIIVSAGTIEMSKTWEVAQLLRQNSVATSLERIPVKHLGYGRYPLPYYSPDLVPYYYPTPQMLNEDALYENKTNKEDQQNPNVGKTAPSTDIPPKPLLSPMS